jgi:hypothetical protein
MKYRVFFLLSFISILFLSSCKSDERKITGEWETNIILNQKFKVEKIIFAEGLVTLSNANSALLGAYKLNPNDHSLTIFITGNMSHSNAYELNGEISGSYKLTNQLLILDGYSNIENQKTDIKIELRKKVK